MKYKIVKMLNNNSIMIIDDKEKSYVAIGNGLGFKYKINDYIDDKKIEKLFCDNSSGLVNKLSESMQKLNENYYQIVEKIFEYSEKQLKRKLDENLYLLLAEHISFTVVRIKSDITVSCPMEHEIKALYSLEYEVSRKIVIYLEKKLELKFPKSEIGLLHFT